MAGHGGSSMLSWGVPTPVIEEGRSVSTAAESIDVARGTHETVLRLGGLFMSSTEMAAAAERYGINDQILCLRGRVSVLGEVDSAEAAEVLGVFPVSILRTAWRFSHWLSAAEAAVVYAGVCAQWGHQHLGDISDSAVIADLAEHIVDAAEVDDLPLVSRWRQWRRPEPPAARLAHALMLLRELRYGLYLAAIRSRGLSIPVTVLASHRGAQGLRRAGWSTGEITSARRCAQQIDDLDEQRVAVEIDADLGFSSCLGVLDVHAQRMLVDGLARVDIATRSG
jgi:hypothetical protein